MIRRNRLALLGALVLLLVPAGSTLANRSPEQPTVAAPPASSHEPEAESEEADEVEEAPTAEDLANAAERLTANEIAFDDATLQDLAARYGLGGAVRVLAWADETGMSAAEITALRDGDETTPGMGWGRIAKDLGTHPGLGGIMGTGHDKDHARDGAPGESPSESDD
ncbi:MAG: hypothetical protein ABIO99_10735 [Candidatus Limnocylindria bacterium]